MARDEFKLFRTGGELSMIPLRRKRRIKARVFTPYRYDAFVTIGILQIRWTDDGDKDVAALATMYIAEVPNESSISQWSFHRMF